MCKILEVFFFQFSMCKKNIFVCGCAYDFIRLIQLLIFYVKHVKSFYLLSPLKKIRQ